MFSCFRIGRDEVFVLGIEPENSAEMKLQAIKQWLQKRGLDPTGDRETCAKRL